MAAISSPQDFKVAALIGKVEGVSQLVIAGRAANIQTAQVPLTVGFGNVLQGLAVGAESWEIVSANAADTAAGTGARTVLIQYLDDSYTQQQVIVTLNGTTPVAIAADCFRHQSAQVITAGSGRTNAGQLTIRVAGAGASRALVAAGFSSSRQASFTVPVGYSAYIQSTQFVTSRSAVGLLTEGIATIAAYLYDATGVRRLGLDFTVGEPAVPLVFPSGILIPAQNTLEYQVTSVNANGVDISILTAGLLINTALVKWPIT